MLSALGSWSGRSAVSSNGSPSGPSQVPLPPTTPPGGNNDSWDLIYAAAGQMARLKMNDEGPPVDRGLLGPPRRLTPIQHPSQPMKNPNTRFYANHCLAHNFSQANHVSLFGLFLYAYIQVQQKNHQNQPTQHGGSGMRAVFLGGSGVKRECAGTGVFLPRRYGNPTDSRKKPVL